MQTTITHDLMTYDEYKTKILTLLRNNTAGLSQKFLEETLQLPRTLQQKQWFQMLKSETGIQTKKTLEDTYLYLPVKGAFFTIGYEGKTIEQFIKKLQDTNIEQIIDVREIALSRKNGFAKNTLKQKLEEKNISYKHFPELGSPASIRNMLYENWNYDEFFKAYTVYLENQEQQKVLTELEEIAVSKRTAIMCFEHDGLKCHRQIIGKRFSENGFGVVNL